MAWIESHQDLPKHWKTKRLMRILNISGPLAVGHLHFLWYWAVDYAQDGEITQYTPYDIADASGWEGDAEAFFNALIEAGFIDVIDDRYFLHDWYDYAGKLIEYRKKDAERKRKSRGNPKDVQRTSDGHPADIKKIPDGVQKESVRNLNRNHNLNQINNLGGVVVEGEPEYLDERFAKVYRTFEQEGFGTISPLMKDTLDHLMYDYTAEWVIRAMHAAAKQSIRKISYVEGILKQWKASGVDEPWNQERTEKVTPYPSRTNRTRSNKPHIPVVEQRTGGEKLSDDELQEAIRLAQELEGA
jgi:DnaD/phage-associated family protein